MGRKKQFQYNVQVIFGRNYCLKVNNIEYIVDVFSRIVNVLTINNDFPAGNCAEKRINFQWENIDGVKLLNKCCPVIPCGINEKVKATIQPTIIWSPFHFSFQITIIPNCQRNAGRKITQERHKFVLLLFATKKG